MLSLPEVVTVSARDRGKQRDMDLSGCRWLDDPVGLAGSPDVDVVVEHVDVLDVGERGEHRRDRVARLARIALTHRHAHVGHAGVLHVLGQRRPHSQAGLDRHHLSHGLRVMREVEAVTAADLDDPAENAIQQRLTVLGGTLGFLETALRDETINPVSRGHLESARTCAWDAANDSTG